MKGWPRARSSYRSFFERSKKKKKKGGKIETRNDEIANTSDDRARQSAIVPSSPITGRNKVRLLVGSHWHSRAPRPPQNLLFMLSSLHLKTPPFSWVAPLRFATFRTTNYASSRLFLLERSRFGWRARTPPDVMQISLAKRTFSTPFFRVEVDESSHPKFRPNSPHIVGLATRRSATWPRYYERRTD